MVDSAIERMRESGRRYLRTHPKAFGGGISPVTGVKSRGGERVSVLDSPEREAEIKKLEPTKLTPIETKSFKAREQLRRMAITRDKGFTKLQSQRFLKQRGGTISTLRNANAKGFRIVQPPIKKEKIELKKIQQQRIKIPLKRQKQIASLESQKKVEEKLASARAAMGLAGERRVQELLERRLAEAKRITPISTIAKLTQTKQKTKGAVRFILMGEKQRKKEVERVKEKKRKTKELEREALSFQKKGKIVFKSPETFGREVNKRAGLTSWTAAIPLKRNGKIFMQDFSFAFDEKGRMTRPPTATKGAGGFMPKERVLFLDKRRSNRLLQEAEIERTKKKALTELSTLIKDRSLLTKKDRLLKAMARKNKVEKNYRMGWRGIL